VSEKYEFIDAEYATLPAAGRALTIVQMCEWLGVSKSGLYDWRTRPESVTSQRRKLLEIKIEALFEANNEEYGYRRIHAALARGGESVDDETVRKIMRDLGLQPCQPKPWRHSLTGEGAIFHSDRGSNYTSAAFAEKLGELGIRQSVGRTGICYDNAMAESFNGVLKNELPERAGSRVN
jgi:transposase InsO family protein